MSPQVQVGQMAKIVFRVVLFSKRHKCTICGRERRFGCEQTAASDRIRRLSQTQTRFAGFAHFQPSRFQPTVSAANSPTNSFHTDRFQRCKYTTDSVRGQNKIPPRVRGYVALRYE